MEELTMVTLGVGRVSLGFIAGHVTQPTQIRTRCAPTVTIVFSEVIAMREQGQSEFGYFWGFQNYWLSVAPNCLSPNFSKYFFFLRHTLPALNRVGKLTASPIIIEGLATQT